MSSEGCCPQTLKCPEHTHPCDMNRILSLLTVADLIVGLQQSILENDRPPLPGVTCEIAKISAALSLSEDTEQPSDFLDLTDAQPVRRSRTLVHLLEEANPLLPSHKAQRDGGPLCTGGICTVMNSHPPGCGRRVDTLGPRLHYTICLVATPSSQLSGWGFQTVAFEPTTPLRCGYLLHYTRRVC